MITLTRCSDLASVLAAPEPVDNLAGLAAHWADACVHVRLSGIKVPDGIGAHLRRSFLGALAVGASDEARANRACPWTPPCALDVFLREQMRGPRGDGLPKPYVIFAEPDKGDMIVGLRVFGVACDWMPAASEALVAGLRDILPWQRLIARPPPPITARDFTYCDHVAIPIAKGPVTLRFLSPVDVSGIRRDIGPSLLSRILRRVAALSRWQGMVLASDATRDLTARIDALDIDTSRMTSGRYESASRHAEIRSHATMQGELRISGDIAPFLPALAIGERCHVGRAAVEGLGRYRLVL